MRAEISWESGWYIWRVYDGSGVMLASGAERTAADAAARVKEWTG